MITLWRAHVEEIFAHAREANPAECCGLIGGSIEEGTARSVYRLRNASRSPLVAYEAAPVELFAAQTSMRERGEEILAIYHSHPRSADPQPSETDVRLAYHPSAFYFIIGLNGAQATLRAFSINEREGRWQRVEYRIQDQ
ncbi:MAG: [CysO sulfur-carrier protein]-S-L-cysteine hydrolase [Blastocatellia bacterium]|jgi:proteasome lid subunit RPN8/RPN11|nr:[CysO sulfur-carrier protein]-S-L-cysteine hydrolase [Blastocatellia bacterium]